VLKVEIQYKEVGKLHRTFRVPKKHSSPALWVTVPQALFILYQIRYRKICFSPGRGNYRPISMRRKMFKKVIRENGGKCERKKGRRGNIKEKREF
jgi:hypothetical protein